MLRFAERTIAGLLLNDPLAGYRQLSRSNTKISVLSYFCFPLQSGW